VLRGVDLDLAAGELVVVTGGDGCGASSLLDVLAGRREPDTGSVDGGPVRLLDGPPGSDWTDGDVVDELAGAGRPLLARLGMRAPGDREMWMVSSGERQRVRLAAALADPCPVLLLDEPLGYLDGAGVRVVLDRLRARAQQGTAVLAVAKADERAAAAADRVLLLQDGVLRAV
jgi:ABC-type multidrug transport system ATPase subunit